MEDLLAEVLRRRGVLLLLLLLLLSRVLMVGHFRAVMQTLYIVQTEVLAVEVVDITVVPVVSGTGVVLHILEILMEEVVVDTFIRV